MVYLDSTERACRTAGQTQRNWRHRLKCAGRKRQRPWPISSANKRSAPATTTQTKKQRRLTMTTRREVEALEKLARAKVRSAEAETKLYGALANALKLPKKPTGEPPIL